MSLLFSLIAHLLVTFARLAKPGGLGAVVAESLAVKHQLFILRRACVQRITDFPQKSAIRHTQVQCSAEAAGERCCGRAVVGDHAVR